MDCVAGYGELGTAGRGEDFGDAEGLCFVVVVRARNTIITAAAAAAIPKKIPHSSSHMLLFRFNNIMPSLISRLNPIGTPKFPTGS